MAISAMSVIDAIHAKGGRVVSFSSFCGGLPAPKDNDNPFGFKLSWSPRGVLLASRNDARFLEGGKEVTIPGGVYFLKKEGRVKNKTDCGHTGKVLFDNYSTEMIQELGIEYECYPNRNSLQYIELYGLHDTKKMIRGTYRLEPTPPPPPPIIQQLRALLLQK